MPASAEPLLLDTSAAVPLIVADHPSHRQVLKQLARRSLGINCARRGSNIVSHGGKVTRARHQGPQRHLRQVTRNRDQTRPASVKLPRGSTAQRLTSQRWIQLQISARHSSST